MILRTASRSTVSVEFPLFALSSICWNACAMVFPGLAANACSISSIVVFFLSPRERYVDSKAQCRERLSRQLMQPHSPTSPGTHKKGYPANSRCDVHVTQGHDGVAKSARHLRIRWLLSRATFYLNATHISRLKSRCSAPYFQLNFMYETHI